MTFFAALLERSFVGIDVAIDAGSKLHVFVAYRPTRHIRLVAFFAGDLDVETRQRIARLRMIELLRGLPIREVVTLQAVVTELALMRVLVARHAILRQPEERPGKILHFDERALFRSHVGGHVTFLTGNARMLSLQVVARQPMIKLFLRRLPVNEIEVLTVVFKMAADAVFAVRVPHLNLRVISALRRQPLRHFLMTIETFEGRSASTELMATRALRRPG